jgi:hypothetical protein
MDLEGSLPRSQEPATCPCNTYVVFLNKYSMFDPNRYGYGQAPFFLLLPQFSTHDAVQKSGYLWTAERTSI